MYIVTRVSCVSIGIRATGAMRYSHVIGAIPVSVVRAH